MVVNRGDSHKGVVGQHCWVEKAKNSEMGSHGTPHTGWVSPCLLYLCYFLWRAGVGPSSQHVGGSVCSHLHCIAPRKQEKTVSW